MTDMNFFPQGESTALAKSYFSLYNSTPWKLRRLLLFLDVAISWSEYNSIVKPHNIVYILKEPIWYNKYIKIGYIKLWYKISKMYIKDSLDKNGN
jgi:hypothetical protein